MKNSIKALVLSSVIAALFSGPALAGKDVTRPTVTAEGTITLENQCDIKLTIDRPDMTLATSAFSLDALVSTGSVVNTCSGYVWTGFKVLENERWGKAESTNGDGSFVKVRLKSDNMTWNKDEKVFVSNKEVEGGVGTTFSIHGTQGAGSAGVYKYTLEAGYWTI